MWLDISHDVNDLYRISNETFSLHAESASKSKAIAKILLDKLFATDVLPDGLENAQRAKQLAEYIGNNVQETISLGHVATQLSLSKDRTRHIVEKELGMPFSQYMLWIRIKLVIRQALADNKSLSQTSLEWGFSDQSHFIRRFKRIFGTIPSSLNNAQFLLL